MNRQDLVASLQARFPGAVIGLKGRDDEQTLTLGSTHLVQIGEFLRDESEAQFRLLLTLTAVQNRIDYQLVSPPNQRRLRLSVAHQPSPDSLSLIWPAANWAERETHDWWDIRFVGHPNLKPLLRTVQKTGLPVGQHKNQKRQTDPPSTPLSDSNTWDSDKFFVPGSRHPTSLEGWFVQIDTDGERVNGIHPILGRRHTGIEKRIEAWPYYQGTLLAARIDGFSAMHADLAYALAVEKLLDVAPPPRAQQLRIIYAELQRIASHLSWLAR